MVEYCTPVSNDHSDSNIDHWMKDCTYICLDKLVRLTKELFGLKALCLLYNQNGSHDSSLLSVTFHIYFLKLYTGKVEIHC